jgi:proline dehydrogenase
MQSFAIIKHHQDIIEKSILDTIRSDHINSLVLECESYKNKILNLEIQAYYTKMIHNSLINDLNEILKDVEK